MHYVHGSDIAEHLVNEVMKLVHDGSWIPLHDEAGADIRSYYLPNDSEILITMLETIIPVPGEFAHEVINMTSPVTWTSTCVKYDIIESYDKLNAIYHLRSVSMFFGGQPLESLLFRTVYVGLEKKLFIQVFRSIDMDQFKFEEGSIVMSFLPSAWILDTPPTINPQHCRLRLVCQTDPQNTIGGAIPGFNKATVFRSSSAGFADAFLYVKNYIIDKFNKIHPNPLIKIGISMETEWADTYCSMNEAFGWTAHVKRFGLSVYSKIDINGNPVVGVKGSYHCPQPLNEVMQSFHNENVAQWEPFLESASLIQRIDENLSLVKLHVRGPISEKALDICLLTLTRKVVGNLGIVMFRSTAHESIQTRAETYLLPSGVSLQPSSDLGGTLVSFMIQGFFSHLDPTLYAPILGARMAMTITNHVKYMAANFATPNSVRHYKSIPAWLADKIMLRQVRELQCVKKLQPLCKLVLDELSANHRLSYPHTSVELGNKRKRPQNPQSITTISGQIAEKREGQFVRPFIFLVDRDMQRKHLKRVSMTNSQSLFDFLGIDILTDLVQYLGVADVIAFSQVCKNFNFFTTGNRTVWKELFWKRYGGVYCRFAPVLREENYKEPVGHCELFEDWRAGLIGKMVEERGWRYGRLTSEALHGHEAVIKYICHSETDNGKNSLLCTSDTSVVKVWSLETNKCVSTITPPAPVVGVQNIPAHNGMPDMFVVGCASGVINFYSWHDRELVQDNIIQDIQLDGFAYLVNNTIVWTQSQVHVFDNNTGQRARTYHDHAQRIKCVMAAKDESLLYVAGKDGKVIIRDLRTDPAIAPQVTLDAHPNACVRSLAWLVRDQSFITASSDASAKFWDIRNISRPCCTLLGHTKAVMCVDTFDKYKIVTGGKDNTVRVWSVLRNTAEEYRTEGGFQGGVYSVKVHKNQIFSGSIHGDLRRWTLQM